MTVTRACGRGPHFLPPLMQAQTLTLMFSGRLIEAIDISERAVEAARLAANRHALVWALMGHAQALVGHDTGAALQAARERRRAAAGTGAQRDLHYCGGVLQRRSRRGR